MRLTVLTMLVVLLVWPAYAQDNCDLRKDSEGVKVYLCTNNNSNFKTIIVELEVPATLAQYTALVLDVEQYQKWQSKVREQKILDYVSPTEFYYYSAVQTPWPTLDRDYVFHLKLIQDPVTKELRMTLEEIPDYIPTKEDIVRLPFAKSELTVTPITSTQVKVRYVLDVDPGGEVPAWLVNIFAANTPWNTYVNFRKLIKAQGENRIEVGFIENYQ